jgi:drug/metabolite transporter (DMT)-like permease
MKKTRTWISFVIIHVIFMGVWGAFIEQPEKNGFPATLGYVVWALTMIPATGVALLINKGKLDYDRNAILYGSLAGLLGAVGQLVLFVALKMAPAYIVFPILSLTPVVTILLAVVFLKESTGLLGWVGIAIGVLAILLLSYVPSDQAATSGYLWILFTIIPLVAWGTQGFVMRFANEKMKAESIFFYMAISSVALIPVAIWMTDFSKPINYGWGGPYLAAGIQVLNAFGALCLVYAFRYGKAIIVAPMTTALSPVLTVVISLSIYSVQPHPLIAAGIALAVVAALLMGSAESKMESKSADKIKNEIKDQVATATVVNKVK